MHANSQRAARLEHFALWGLQWALALVLLASACFKLFFGWEEMHAALPWTRGVPPWFVDFIAIIEVTGAVGVVLPALLRVIPHLTPVAASGIAVLQLLALTYHLGRGEFSMIPLNLVLMFAALVIAWGRFNHLPIASVTQPVSEHIDDPGEVPRGMV